MSKKINLNTEKTFRALQQSNNANDLYVPQCVKRVVEKLDGKTIPLREAFEKIRNATVKRVKISKKRFILVQISCYGVRVVEFHSKRKNAAKKAALV